MHNDLVVPHLGLLPEIFLEGLRKTREMKIRVTDVLVEILRQNNSEYKQKRVNPLNTELNPICRQAASSVHYTTSCKHSLALPRMGEIITRNRLS